MARTHERIIALVIAVTFFATAFTTSFFVIWQLYKDNKEAKVVNQSTNNTPSQKLQGTQLANFTPVPKIEKLERQELTPGTGDVVPEGASITVDYTGAFASSGTIFESSLDSGQPASFSLSGVITGWTEGIPGAKVGGTYRLLIPYDKGYGENDYGNIPGKSDLVFDITVRSID